MIPTRCPATPRTAASDGSLVLGAPLKSSDLCLPPHMNPNSYQSCSFRIPKARGPACIGLKRLRVSAKVSHGPLSELSTGDLQRSGPRKRGLSLHPGPTAPGRDRRPFPGMGAFRPHGAPLLEVAFLGGPLRSGRRCNTCPKTCQGKQGPPHSCPSRQVPPGA